MKNTISDWLPLIFFLLIISLVIGALVYNLWYIPHQQDIKLSAFCNEKGMYLSTNGCSTYLDTFFCKCINNGKVSCLEQFDCDYALGRLK